EDLIPADPERDVVHRLHGFLRLPAQERSFHERLGDMVNNDCVGGRIGNHVRLMGDGIGWPGSVDGEHGDSSGCDRPLGVSDKKRTAGENWWSSARGGNAETGDKRSAIVSPGQTPPASTGHEGPQTD